MNYFKQWMIEIGAWEKYLKYVPNIDSVERDLSADLYIDTPFSWSKTDEGIEYWGAINTAWYKEFWSKVIFTHFREFLEEHEIAEKYEKNLMLFGEDKYTCLGSITALPPRRYFSAPFKWRETNEGFAFWKSIDIQWNHKLMGLTRRDDRRLV